MDDDDGDNDGGDDNDDTNPQFYSDLRLWYCVTLHSILDLFFLLLSFLYLLQNILGRHEMANIFSDVGIAIEMRQKAERSNQRKAAKQALKAARAAANGNDSEGGSPSVASRLPGSSISSGHSSHTSEDDSDTDGSDTDDSAHIKTLTSQRFKYDENLTVEQRRDNQLYKAVSDYLILNDDFGEENGEELLVVPFQDHIDKENGDQQTRQHMLEHAHTANNMGKSSDDKNSGVSDATGGYPEAKADPFDSQRTDLSTYLNSSDIFSLNPDQAQGTQANSSIGGTEVTTLDEQYDLLVRSLSLANRYEHHLLRISKQIRSNKQTSIKNLISDDSWYRNLDFEADFCRDLYTPRHTAGSKSKMRAQLHGLEPAVRVKIHPSSLPGHYAHEDLFEEVPGVIIDRGEHQTNKEYTEAFNKSLRFHSVDNVAAAGTSIARSDGHNSASTHTHLIHRMRRTVSDKRQKHLTGHNPASNSQVDSPLSLNSALNNSTMTNDTTMSNKLPASYTYTPKFTKTVVNPHSKFLQTTESRKNDHRARVQQQEEKKEKTHAQLHQDYIDSLRTDEVKTGPRWNRYTTGQNNPHIKGAGALSGLEPKGGSDNAVPFPEHLRHRIRRKGDDGDTDPTQGGRKGTSQGGKRTTQGSRGHHRGRTEGNTMASRLESTDQDNVDALLSEYDEMMAGHDSYQEHYDSLHQESVHSGSSGYHDGSLIRDEDLPDELPDDVGDANLRQQWKAMSLKQKRQSIHFLFPRGDTLHRKGAKSFPTPLPSSTGMLFNSTKSANARIQARTRASIFQFQANQGMIPGTSRQYSDIQRDLNSGSYKAPFRPAGVAGLDKTYAGIRKLAKRPSDFHDPHWTEGPTDHGHPLGSPDQRSSRAVSRSPSPTIRNRQSPQRQRYDGHKSYNSRMKKLFGSPLDSPTGPRQKSRQNVPEDIGEVPPEKPPRPQKYQHSNPNPNPNPNPQRRASENSHHMSPDHDFEENHFSDDGSGGSSSGSGESSDGGSDRNSTGSEQSEHSNSTVVSDEGDHKPTSAGKYSAGSSIPTVPPSKNSTNSTDPAPTGAGRADGQRRRSRSIGNDPVTHEAAWNANAGQRGSWAASAHTSPPATRRMTVGNDRRKSSDVGRRGSAGSIRSHSSSNDDNNKNDIGRKEHHLDGFQYGSSGGVGYEPGQYSQQNLHKYTPGFGNYEGHAYSKDGHTTHRRSSRGGVQDTTQPETVYQEAERAERIDNVMARRSSRKSFGFASTDLGVDASGASTRASLSSKGSAKRDSKRKSVSFSDTEGSGPEESGSGSARMGSSMKGIFPEAPIEGDQNNSQPESNHGEVEQKANKDGEQAEKEEEEYKPQPTFTGKSAYDTDDEPKAYSPKGGKATPVIVKKNRLVRDRDQLVKFLKAGLKVTKVRELYIASLLFRW